MRKVQQREEARMKREIEAENMLQEAIRSYPGTGVRIIGGESAAK